MKIRKSEYQAVLDYLVKKRWGGEEFVAFIEDNLSVDKRELFTFQEQYEAQEFCYEMSTDRDSWNYLSIRSVIRSMQEALKDKALMIERDGIVDVSVMVSLRYRRLEDEQLNNNQKFKIMNEENYEYLSNQVKFSGFGESLNENLKEAIKGNEPFFTLLYQPEFGNGDVKATLHFRRSEETGMVFFNRYDLEVKQAADIMKQTFFIGRENNFTLKEAFNLMEGRSVYKELDKLQQVGQAEQTRYESTGEKYNAWVQLDFKESDQYGNFKMKYYHENYGFNLSDALAKLPIRELDDTEKKSQMVRSLERGNLHTVTYVKDGEDQKASVMAVPQFKTAKLFDESGKEIRMGSRQSKEKKQSENQSQEQESPGEQKNNQNKKRTKGKKVA